MSSRAFRRLNRDADVIKLPSLAGEEDETEEQINPSLQSQKRKQKAVNPFELVRNKKMHDGSRISMAYTLVSGR